MGYCPMEFHHEVQGRIITPIYDAYGELIVLSTRHLNENVRNRFWHETFDKGSYLYGLYYAKKTIYKINKVIVVEGEFDVAAFHTNGFTMTVGCCGSAFTLFQISLLSKYCTDFYLFFDGDTAGRAAIERAMKMYEKYSLNTYGLNFFPVFLPEGYDPDDYIKEEGREGVRKKLITAREDGEFII